MRKWLLLLALCTASLLLGASADARGRIVSYEIFDGSDSTTANGKDSIAAGSTVAGPPSHVNGGAGIPVLGARQIIIYVVSGNTAATAYVDSFSTFNLQCSLDYGSTYRNFAVTNANSDNVILLAAWGAQQDVSTRLSTAGGYRAAHVYSTSATAGQNGSVFVPITHVKVSAVVKTRPREPASTGNAAMFGPIKIRVHVVFDDDSPEPYLEPSKR